jgi:hypothetical protein
MKNATKNPRLKVTQSHDIQYIKFRKPLCH